MPSCLTTVRATSATVTFSMTWSRPRTAIELTTLSWPPTRRAALSPARRASPRGRAPHEPGGNVDALLRRGGGRRHAAEHHAVADALDLDVRIRQRLLQRGA